MARLGYAAALRQWLASGVFEAGSESVKLWSVERRSNLLLALTFWSLRARISSFGRGKISDESAYKRNVEKSYSYRMHSETHKNGVQCFQLVLTICDHFERFFFFFVYRWLRRNGWSLPWCVVLVHSRADLLRWKVRGRRLQGKGLNWTHVGIQHKSSVVIRISVSCFLHIRD